MRTLILVFCKILKYKKTNNKLMAEKTRPKEEFERDLLELKSELRITIHRHKHNKHNCHTLWNVCISYVAVCFEKSHI